MKSKSPTLILFASLVIVMLGFGIALPLMAFFITHFNASGAAMGIMMASYSIMQFLFAPLWGRLSDRIGRKPVFLIGITGYALAFLAQGFSPTLFLFIGSRALAGVLSSATLPTAMAYVADITSAENRSKGVGMMGAAMGIGMIFGPMLGGMLANAQFSLPPALAAIMQIAKDPQTGRMINLSIPFLVSSLLAFITIPFVHFLLPESLTVEKRQLQPDQSNQGSQFKQLGAALAGPLGYLLAMAFLLSFALANMEGVLPLYGQNSFNMGPSSIGFIMGAMGILSVIEQGFLIGPLTRRFGEVNLLLGGLVISMIGLFGMAIFQYRWGLIGFSLVFSSGNVMLQPSVTSLISQRAKPGEVGTAMGFNNSFQSLGRGIGPLWAGFAYDIYPTLSFWSGGIIQLAAFIFGLFTLLGKITLKPSLPVQDEIETASTKL